MTGTDHNLLGTLDDLDLHLLFLDSLFRLSGLETGKQLSWELVSTQSE